MELQVLVDLGGPDGGAGVGTGGMDGGAGKGVSNGLGNKD